MNDPVKPKFHRLGVDEQFFNADGGEHIYTYKDLDIAFSMKAGVTALYGELIPYIGFFMPYVGNPDGQGAFQNVGEVVVPNLESPPGGAKLLPNPIQPQALEGFPAATVRPHPGSDGSAVAHPTGYSAVWSLRKGEWTVWRPNPPQGYAALGCVSTWDGDGNPPPVTAVVCVRRDLVARAETTQWSWADHDSGASESITIWDIQPKPPAAEEINFTPGTYVAASYYGAPGADVEPFSLRLPFPAVEPHGVPHPPSLTEPGVAPPAGTDTVEAATNFPSFAVNDPEFNAIADQMLANPEYKLVRVDRYTLIPGCVVWNQTSIEQSDSFTATAGYNTQETEDFSETTGIDFGAQFGGADSPVTFSVQLSQTFTMSESLSHGVSVDYSVTVPVVAPPDSTVAAYWKSSTFQLMREDGSKLGNPVTVLLDETVSFQQYPPKGDSSASSEL